MGTGVAGLGSPSLCPVSSGLMSTLGLTLSGLFSHSLIKDNTNTEDFQGGIWKRPFHPAYILAPRYVPDSRGCARMTLLHGVLIWNLESGWFHRSPQSCPSFLPVCFLHSLICLPDFRSRTGMYTSALHTQDVLC